jgi:HEAT repeat protein
MFLVSKTTSSTDILKSFSNSIQNVTKNKYTKIALIALGALAILYKANVLENIAIRIQAYRLATMPIEEKKSAIVNLGENGGDRSVALLKGMKNNPVEHLRISVAIALSKIAGDKSITVLKEMKNDSSKLVQLTVLLALGDLHKFKDVDLLEEIKGSTDHIIQTNLTIVLAELGSPRCVTFLDSMKDHSNKLVKEAVATALSKIGSAKCLELLKEMKEDEIFEKQHQNGHNSE